MSEQERRLREACDRFAPTLALLDDPGASAPDERRAALDHLAGCAWCRAEQRADARLDAALRRAFDPATSAAAASLHTRDLPRDLLAAIGATSEPAATPGRHARPTIRSVIYLGDLNAPGALEGVRRMSEQDEHGERADDEPTYEPIPPRRMAAIPSLRPGPRERAQGRRRWAVSLGATAAALALIVVAAALFSSRAQLVATQTAHNGAHNAVATQTASAVGKAEAANVGPLAAISLDSPTDGWALGDASSQQSGSSTTAAALYHYDGVRWTLKQEIQGFDPFGNGNIAPSMQMLSTRDGWIINPPNIVLRYDGTTWRRVTIALPGGQQISQLQALDMVSPTEGWAAALLDGPQATLAFLRYDGQQWTIEASDISLSSLGLDPNTLSVTGVSAAPGGDVWAIGAATSFATPNTQSGLPTTGLIFQRTGGVWRVARMLNQPNTSAQLIPHGMLMLSPTVGWIVGETDEMVTENVTSGVGVGVTTQVTAEVTHALLLRYDGADWTEVPAPLNTPTEYDRLLNIGAAGPNDIWVTVQSAAGIVQSSGATFSGDLLHYDGAHWSDVTPTVHFADDTTASVGNLGVAPNGDLWVVGSSEVVQNQQGSLGPLVCEYTGGVWSLQSVSLPK